MAKGKDKPKKEVKKPKKTETKKPSKAEAPTRQFGGGRPNPQQSDLSFEGMNENRGYPRTIQV